VASPFRLAGKGKPPSAGSRRDCRDGCCKASPRREIHTSGARFMCRGIMTAYLNHIERLNPPVNCHRNVCKTEGELRRQARENRDGANCARTFVRARCTVFRMPVKDSSSRPRHALRRWDPRYWKDTVPRPTHWFVSRMRKAWSNFYWEKTNTPEIRIGFRTRYNPVFGSPTHNAYNSAQIRRRQQRGRCRG